MPTLVVHGARNPVIGVAHRRYLAARTPGARYLELPIGDHDPLGAELEGFLARVEEFLTGAVRPPPRNRVLATVLFTDIVDSTGHASRRGDARWRGLLDEHDAALRSVIERYRGEVVQPTGDRFLALFDGPARAVECARAAVSTAEALGLGIRAGIHTGECERRDDNVGGLAVHIGARVTAIAGAGEVFVSRTVKDLVAGSRLHFTDRGEHPLRGVPDLWRLYCAEP